MTLDFASVLGRWPMFVDGAWMTIRLAAGATLIGWAIGTLCAIGRRSNLAWARRASTMYVEVIRNTPLLVQIFLVYFGLASLGLKLPAVGVALATRWSSTSAPTPPRSCGPGFDSIHKGQLEAAECLALSRRQIYWHVVLLPAMERVYPALTSQFVLLMLASSVCSQISAEELTAVANFVQSDTYRRVRNLHRGGPGLHRAVAGDRAGFWGVGQLLFPRRRRLGTPCDATPAMTTNLNAIHFLYLLARHALDGRPVADRLRGRRPARPRRGAVPRFAIEPLRCAHLRLRPVDPGHAAADDPVHDVLRAGAYWASRFRRWRRPACRSRSTSVPTWARSGAAASSRCPRPNGRRPNAWH